MELDHTEIGERGWRGFFEDRYGRGAYERLLSDLGQPCTTFAAIAKRLGVTRERVRQWQMMLLPDAPRGLERRRLCAALHQKARVHRDPLFRDFCRHARVYLAVRAVDVVQGSAGYRRRMARIGSRTVALRSARPVPDVSQASPAPEYRLAAYRGDAEYVYYRLTRTEYLLMPAHHLRSREVRFVDTSASRYFPFKNTFAAIEAEAVPSGAEALECRC
jgi:hypothetical protein